MCVFASLSFLSVHWEGINGAGVYPPYAPRRYDISKGLGMKSGGGEGVSEGQAGFGFMLHDGCDERDGIAPSMAPGRQRPRAIGSKQGPRRWRA
jgi:hypothetical protein